MQLNPGQLKKAMQKMGIRSEEIEAEEVIIKTKGKNLVVKNPQVSKVSMMGQDTLQVVGEITEESSITDEDINLVMEQTKSSKSEAKLALEKAKGDIAKAILSLKS